MDASVHMFDYIRLSRCWFPSCDDLCFHFGHVSDVSSSQPPNTLEHVARQVTHWPQRPSQSTRCIAMGSVEGSIAWPRKFRYTLLQDVLFMQLWQDCCWMSPADDSHLINRHSLHHVSSLCDGGKVANKQYLRDML